MLHRLRFEQKVLFRGGSPLHDYDKGVVVAWFMRDNAIPAISAKIRPILVALLTLLSTVVTVAGPVQAVGVNQTDLGTGGDLPDNMSATTSNFTSPLAGLAPFNGTDYGQLDVNDDEDWLAINLSANEGLALSLSFNTTYTSSNGSTYTNDFDLAISWR